MANKFKKKSVILMLIFTFINLGIYIPVYFLRLKRVTDTLNTTKKASESVIQVLLGFSIMEVALGIAYLVYPLAFFDVVGTILNITDGILILVLCFQFRSILNEHFKGITETHFFSGLWTIIFSIYYLQYKINWLMED